MMAGLLIISMISGAVAGVVALALSLPFWVAFLAYSACGMITLVVIATIVSLRGNGGAPAFSTGRLSPASATARR
jgi:hypothetical protein